MQSVRESTRRIAFCGILTALMTMIMMVGTLFPLATYLCPCAAGALLIAPQWEYGNRTCIPVFLAVSILSLMMAPDKEAVFLFIFLLGWYPIVHPYIRRIRVLPLRLLAKLLICNLAAGCAYAILLFVLVMPDLQSEFSGWTVPFFLIFLLCGNVAFLLYDRCLPRLCDLYLIRLRPKLFSGFRRS